MNDDHDFPAKSPALHMGMIDPTAIRLAEAAELQRLKDAVAKQKGMEPAPCWTIEGELSCRNSPIAESPSSGRTASTGLNVTVDSFSSIPTSELYSRLTQNPSSFGSVSRRVVNADIATAADHVRTNVPSGEPINLAFDPAVGTDCLGAQDGSAMGYVSKEEAGLSRHQRLMAYRAKRREDYRAFARNVFAANRAVDILTFSAFQRLCARRTG